MIKSAKQGAVLAALLLAVSLDSAQAVGKWPTRPPTPSPVADEKDFEGTPSPTTLVPVESTQSPSVVSTDSPTPLPTLNGVVATVSPTLEPTVGSSPVTGSPTESPTVSDAPTGSPTVIPSTSPSTSPSGVPTVVPTDAPSVSPTTALPTQTPTKAPTDAPTFSPTVPQPLPIGPTSVVFAFGGDTLGYHARRNTFVIQGTEGVLSLTSTCTANWSVIAEPRAFTCQVDCAGAGWVGIGLGTQMVDADIVLGATDSAFATLETYKLGADSKASLDGITPTGSLLALSSFGTVDGVAKLSFMARTIGNSTFFPGEEEIELAQDGTAVDQEVGPTLGLGTSTKVGSTAEESTSAVSPEMAGGLTAGAGIVLLAAGVVLVRRRATKPVPVPDVVTAVVSGTNSAEDFL